MKIIHRIFIALTLISFNLIALADGPVPASSLSGGATLNDSDTGNGESWGRVNGRNWSFYGFDLSRFNSLTWSVVDNTSVGIAFDGTINSGTPEELSISSVTGNQAIWTGSTQVLIVTSGTNTPVDTRFVLTLTSGGIPISFQINNMTGLPFVDVATANGQFSLNLKMEAKLSSATVWEPALDLFDRLDTDPLGEGLAQTSLRNGFYFDLVGEGLSLEEHDANMNSKGDQLRNDIDFLKGETVGRLSQLVSDVDFLKTDTGSRLIQILNDTDNIERLIRELPQPDQNNGYPTIDDIRNVVSERLQEITQTLIFLWGIDISQGPPDPSTVTLISDLATQEQILSITTELQNLQQMLNVIEAKIEPAIEPKHLELEVVKTTKHHHSKKKKGRTQKLLVLSKENGETVDVSFVSVQAIKTTSKAPSSVIDVDYITSSLATGLAELNLKLPSSLKSIKTFIIKAQHVDADGKTHHQSTFVSSENFKFK